jgi:uncharacterized membrane protein
MNFPDTLLPSSLHWIANFLALLLLALALIRAPWRWLKRTDILNVFMGAAVTLIMVWSIKAGIKPGLNFHMLGATLLTLMFGPWLALAVLSLVLGAVTITGSAGWISFGANFLLMAALPVMMSYAIFRAADRHLPNHLFVYIFVSGFIAAGLAMVTCGLVSATLLRVVGTYTSAYLGSQYLPFFILMGWSEAMLTGMAITLMVVYRPDWVCTFSDERYLKSQT